VHSSKYSFSLNGNREIEVSVSTNKIPSKFQHKVEVPGLAKLTVPAFDKIDKFYSKEYYTNCYSKCRIANFEFTMVNADRPIKRQIERSENMRHFIG
jgi:hypothetical protein